MARAFSAGSEPSWNKESCYSPRRNLVAIDNEQVRNNLYHLRAHGKQPLHRIPDINQQIQEQVEATEHKLEELGHPPSDDSAGEIDIIVDWLVRDVESGIERVSREEGSLLYRIEDEAMRLKSELRATCAEFRAWNKDLKEPPPIPPLPDFLLEELPTPGRTRKIIYLDEVSNRKTRCAVTRLVL